MRTAGANDVRGVAVKDAAVYLAGVNAATATTNSTSKRYVYTHMPNILTTARF
jgi:hypothetical protein